MTSIRLQGIKACVFDAYGTLFDVNSASRAAQDALGSRWQPLADLWRTKQLQYTWLRGLGGHHADFWQVTSDALSFAMESLRIDDADLHRRLMSLYLSLDVFPEVKPTLERLKAGGLKLAILSNGTPAMLASAVEHSGIGPLLDAVLSVEERRRLQAASFRLPPGVRSTEACAAGDLLRLVQRLGRAMPPRHSGSR